MVCWVLLRPTDFSLYIIAAVASTWREFIEKRFTMLPYSKEEYQQAPIFPDASAGYIILRDHYDNLLRNLNYPDDDRVVVPASPRRLAVCRGSKKRQW
jgi:hypothetical protein